MKLIFHIEESYGGRKDRFAASMNVSPQQVSRWLKYGCIWYEGAVWKQQSKSLREAHKQQGESDE